MAPALLVCSQLRFDDSMSERWYHCVEHDRVEPEVGCPVKNRLGPYESREAAEEALERVKVRNAAWKSEDQRWENRG